jgi:hypothetical protein
MLLWLQCWLTLITLSVLRDIDGQQIFNVAVRSGA